MKNTIIRGLVGAALTGAMIAGPVSLAAAAKHTTTTTVSTTTTSASAAWHAQLKVIDQTFIAAVNKANAAYRVAVTTTVTQAKRAAARVALKSAFATAEATYNT